MMMADGQRQQDESSTQERTAGEHDAPLGGENTLQKKNPKKNGGAREPFETGPVPTGWRRAAPPALLRSSVGHLAGPRFRVRVCVLRVRACVLCAGTWSLCGAYFSSSFGSPPPSARPPSLLDRWVPRESPRVLSGLNGHLRTPSATQRTSAGVDRNRRARPDGGSHGPKK